MALGMPNMTNTSPKPKTSGFLSALGGAASIAAPILGNIIGNIGRRKAEREARDYNHPAAQMARLQEAGLNPNLIYGSSPAQAAGTGQAPDYQMKISSQDILNTQTLRQISAQTQNIKAQTRLADMNAAATSARIPGLQAESDNAMRKILADIGQKEAQTDLIKAQTKSALVDAGIKTATQQQQVIRLINESALSNENLKGKQLQNVYDGMRNQLMELGISPGDRIWIKALGMLLPSLKDRLPSIYDLIK
jgi:hypothetical protein